MRLKVLRGVRAFFTPLLPDDDIIFGGQLRRLDERHGGYRLETRLTRVDGRLVPADLEELCGDWREREEFVCGPAEMLDALATHWEQEGGATRWRQISRPTCCATCGPT